MEEMIDIFAANDIDEQLLPEVRSWMKNKKRMMNAIGSIKQTNNFFADSEENRSQQKKWSSISSGGAVLQEAETGSEQGQGWMGGQQGRCW